MSDKSRIQKDVKKIAKTIVKAESAEATKRRKHKARQDSSAQKAARSLVAQHRSSPSRLLQANAKMFARAFTDRHASILRWMLTVTDPFGEHAYAVPPVLAPGVPMSPPRIYRYVFNGFADANAVGRLYIGANADMWLPDPSAAAITSPVPQKCFLGNSTANGGSRGAPVHYTGATYGGTGTGTGFSYPSPTTTAATGLTFMSFPDNFVVTQMNNAPASANAYQRAQCVSVGLRVRPIAPPSGALLPTGTLVMVQQILGDTVQTNPAAANAAATIGGVDAYQYIMGAAAGSGGTPLTPDQVAVEEWDVMEWPNKGGEKSWLSAAAVPNQSCALGAWVPKQTGDSVVSYPQLAVLGQGLGASGVRVQFQVAYVYAFYGSVSYEVNAHKSAAPVPIEDMQTAVAAAAPHMAPGSSLAPAKQAVLATVQPHVDSGDVPKSSAGDWVKSGATAIEAATGSTIGDLVGEGLGFLAAALL